MSDDYRIVDYSIQLNDVVQLIDRKTFSKDLSNNTICVENHHYEVTTKTEVSEFRNDEEKGIEIPCISKYYKKGDYIDFIHNEHGSWYEGIIVDIVKKINKYSSTDSDIQEEDILFKVKMEM